MRLEDNISDEFERMPNHFDSERQAEILKAVSALKPQPFYVMKLRSVRVVLAGIVVCGLLLFAFTETRRHVAQTITTSADSTGETFGPKLMSQINDAARRDERTFQVYVPTGGFDLVKVPELLGWTSGANQFGLQISEKGTLSPLYDIVEAAYSGPFDMSSYTKIGDINGVTVYEHRFNDSATLYSFRIGYTSFSMTVTTMEQGKGLLTFPNDLLLHLAPYQAIGLALPSSAKQADDTTIKIPFPYSESANGVLWRLNWDPGNRTVVEVRDRGKLLLVLSVPALNQKQVTQNILLGGETYTVSNINVNSDNLSGEITLVKQPH